MPDLRPVLDFIRFLRNITDEFIVWRISLIGGYHAIRYSLRIRGRRQTCRGRRSPPADTTS
jgi:hypothetical protein